MDLPVAGVTRLLEVGIAVDNATRAARDFSQLFHAPCSDLIAEEKNFAIRFRMCRVGDVDLEIMETSRPDGLIRRFIDGRGEGLHHIAFLVEDAEAMLDRLRLQGVPVLSEKPVRLANLKAFFVHPAFFGGILLEFVENLHPWLDGKAFVRDETSPLIHGLLDGSTIRGIVANVDDLAATADALKLLGARDFNSRNHPSGSALSCSLGNITLTLSQEGRAPPGDQAAAGWKGLQRVDVEVDDPDRCAALASSSSAYVLRGADRDDASEPAFIVSGPDFRGTAFGLFRRTST